jgi:GNAT superfamily N-acetyltransferase
MYEWLFEEPGYRPPQWDPDAALRRIRDAIESELAAVFIATDEAGPPAGLCTAYLELESIRYGQRCWVEDLAVSPEHRSEGVGGRLLDAAQDWARDRGATHFELDTGLARVDAQRFYEARGDPAKGYSYSWPL